MTSKNKASLHALALWWPVPLLLVAMSPGPTYSADEVEFVVGGLMVAEGGEWEPEKSPLKAPFGVDFNRDGEMWIVELEGGRVHKLDTTGKLHHAGGDGSKSYKGDGGNLSEATFNGMHNCAVTPNGDLYIADSWNHCIRKVDAESGKVSTVAGTGQRGYSGDGGVATKATFDFVMCITLSPTNDVLHIADINNRRIRALDLKSGVVTTVAGNGKRGGSNGRSGRDAESIGGSSRGGSGFEGQYLDPGTRWKCIASRAAQRPDLHRGGNRPQGIPRRPGTKSRVRRS